MTVKRGEVALFPFAAGTTASRRPVLILQSDAYNQRLRNTIVAQITSNLRRAGDPAHLLIDIATADGQQSGLLHSSLVSCLNLATFTDDRIDRVIGRLSVVLMAQVDECLKVALGLP